MDKEKCCHCSQRKKERSPEEYKKLIHRLNRIEGQIRGIRGMVENGAYCPDILVQSAAVNAAVNGAACQPYSFVRGAGYPGRQGRSDRRARRHAAKVNEITQRNSYYRYCATGSVKK